MTFSDFNFRRNALKRKKIAYHDLDYLAGTWSAKDARTFNESLGFEKIDCERNSVKIGKEKKDT